MLLFILGTSASSETRACVSPLFTRKYNPGKRGTNDGYTIWASGGSVLQAVAQAGRRSEGFGANAQVLAQNLPRGYRRPLYSTIRPTCGNSALSGYFMLPNCIILGTATQQKDSDASPSVYKRAKCLRCPQSVHSARVYAKGSGLTQDPSRFFNLRRTSAYQFLISGSKCERRGCDAEL